MIIEAIDYKHNDRELITIGMDTIGPLDSITFELSDFIIRPYTRVFHNYYYIESTHLNDYTIELTFNGSKLCISSFNKQLIRHYFKQIVSGNSVLESDIRSQFPELFI